MPADEWRKATMRAKYGPVRYEKGPRKSRRRKRKRKAAAAKQPSYATLEPSHYADPPKGPTPGLTEQQHLVAFLALVDCEPWEVLETSQQRSQGETLPWPPGLFPKLYFGKHKGKSLDEVPSHYLRWALTVRDPGRYLRRFQELARQELARRNHKDFTDEAPQTTVQ